MGIASKNTASFGPSLRIGVLGGGQLGRMMIQSAIDFDARVEVMDPARMRRAAISRTGLCKATSTMPRP